MHAVDATGLGRAHTADRFGALAMAAALGRWVRERRATLVLHDGTASSRHQGLALAAALDRRAAAAAPRRVIVRRAPWPEEGGAAGALLRALPPWALASGSWASGKIVLGDRARAAALEDTARREQVGLVVACGRRAAAASAGLRWARGTDEVANVQILNPRCGPLAPWLFDWIVTPQHDRLAGPHVFSTVGAMSWVSEEVLASRRDELRPPEEHSFASFLREEPRRVAFLCGGDTPRRAADVGSVLRGVRAVLDASCMPATAMYAVGSRRTPPALFDALEASGVRVWRPPAAWVSRCDRDHVQVADLFNPYESALAFADGFVVTGDSVSMVSDACSTARPVVVLRHGVDGEGAGSKLARFHDAVESVGRVQTGARELRLGSQCKPLRDAAEASEFILHFQI